MPQVHDQHQPLLLPVVPHLVLEGVVEDEDLSLPPAQRLVGHAQPHPRLVPLVHREAEVRAQAAVGGTGVRVHVRPRVHHAELDLAARAGLGRGDLEPFSISVSQRITFLMELS